MTQPRIAIASLGGTITMIADETGSGGVVPSLNVDDLLASVPSLERIATLSAATLATVPGASLAHADIYRALEWCRAQIDAGADGAVLIQGTDTIEESSYLLDLHWDRPEPIVVTGAMRSPATPGTDGPSNLLASVRVAASPASRNHGVVVVLNDEIHTAARVQKMRSSGTNAFASPGFGPIGYIEEGNVIYGNGPVRWPTLEGAVSAHSPRIALLETYLGDDASVLNLVSGAEVDGIVVAGFGVGHLSAPMADALERASDNCPVVYATRTGSGTTFSKTYGFVGSESDLLARGAIPSGWLDPRKARILLGSLIATGADREKIRAEFALRGGRPGGPTALQPSPDGQQRG